MAGRHCCYGARQSTPAISIDNSAEVNESVPVDAAFAGQRKTPCSSRLVNRHSPVPSQKTILMRLALRPRNTNRWPEKGSCRSTRRTADQMPLNIECVVDRRMNRNEALSGFGRFEALHLSFSSSNRLMRVLRTVVDTQSLLMPSRETNFANRCPVRSQFISDDDRGDKALAAKELAQKAHCRGLVAPGLNKNFQNLALAIDSAPHVHLLSRERDHQSSGPGESHPQALTDPDVSVSTHPAPTVQPPDTAMANVQ